ELLIQGKPALNGPSGRSSNIELAMSLPPECLLSCSQGTRLRKVRDALLNVTHGVEQVRHSRGLGPLSARGVQGPLMSRESSGDGEGRRPDRFVLPVPREARKRVDLPV